VCTDKGYAYLSANFQWSQTVAAQASIAQLRSDWDAKLNLIGQRQTCGR
jgi:hypothetical protein